MAKIFERIKEVHCELSIIYDCKVSSGGYFFQIEDVKKKHLLKPNQPNARQLTRPFETKTLQDFLSLIDLYNQKLRGSSVEVFKDKVLEFHNSWGDLISMPENPDSDSLEDTEEILKIFQNSEKKIANKKLPDIIINRCDLTYGFNSFGEPIPCFTAGNLLRAIRLAWAFRWHDEPYVQCETYKVFGVQGSCEKWFRLRKNNGRKFCSKKCADNYHNKKKGSETKLRTKINVKMLQIKNRMDKNRR